MNMKRYILEVADRTCLPRRYRTKIMSDLKQEFEQGFAQGYSEQEIMDKMGSPDDVASEIYDNFISIEETSRPFIEYKSEKEIFGMPLVHIVKGKRLSKIRSNSYYNNFNSYPMARGVIAIGRRAKGIIAIGNLSCGIISIGNLSVGVISLSNLGIGLITVGNFGIGLLLAISNLAIGLLAIGNCVLGLFGVGNAVCAYHAMGHSVIGKYEVQVNNFGIITREMEQFINNLPLGLDKFFRFGVLVVDNIDWVLLALIPLLILIIVIGKMLALKMEGDI